MTEGSGVGVELGTVEVVDLVPVAGGKRVDVAVGYGPGVYVPVDAEKVLGVIVSDENGVSKSVDEKVGV
jgi:hypothetical protein